MKRRFFFLLPLVLLTFACATITNVFSPSVMIILKPVDPTAANVASLAQARDIIQKRLQSAGIRNSVSLQDGSGIAVGIYSSKDLEAARKLSTEIGAIAFVDSAKPYPQGAQFGAKLDPVMTLEDIQSVMVEKDSVGGYQVAFQLTPAGTKKMADYTRDNIGHYLLIVKDGVIISSPVINAQIAGGSGVISGAFGQQDANLLAAQLSAQSLPFALQVEQIKQ
jgi:preprotein translocase subunit SecD